MNGEIHKRLTGKRITNIMKDGDDLVIYTKTSVVTVSFDEHGPQFAPKIYKTHVEPFTIPYLQHRNLPKSKVFAAIADGESLKIVFHDGHEIVIGPGPRFLRKNVTTKLPPIYIAAQV